MKAGFAKIAITPGPENSLLGYDYRQQHLPPGNAGVHDPLYARVLVLQEDDGPPAAIVSLDLCILAVGLARHLRGLVATALGCGSERVLLCTTHTHSGPLPQRAGDKGEFGDFLTPFITPEQTNPDAAYAVRLEVDVKTAAAQAGGLLVPVTVSTHSAPLGIAYTRRVPTATGIKLCWNPQEAADLKPAGSADPACTILTLRQIDGPREFVIFNVGAHPVCLGKTSRVVSADWPGAACAAIDATGPHVHSLFLQGACGDTHAWVATQGNPEPMELVGHTVGSFVNLLRQVPGHSGTGLKVQTQTITMGKTELDLAVWRIGPLWLASAPVELFAELGAQLRAQLGGLGMVVTMANGWTGYWPTESAFAEGEYEVNAAQAMGRSPGDGEKLVAELNRLTTTIR